MGAAASLGAAIAGAAGAAEVEIVVNCTPHVVLAAGAAIAGLADRPLMTKTLVPVAGDGADFTSAGLATVEAVGQEIWVLGVSLLAESPLIGVILTVGVLAEGAGFTAGAPVCGSDNLFFDVALAEGMPPLTARALLLRIGCVFRLIALGGVRMAGSVGTAGRSVGLT
jgi:hypothetical protein